MKKIPELFRQKLIWQGFVLAIAVVAVLSFALLGSTVNPAPKHMPVALVMQDSGVKLPDGSEVNFGKQIEGALTGAAGTASPLEWTRLDSLEAAQDALDRQEYYAALIIPATTTAGLLTVQTASPQQVQADILLNQGKNYSGASAVGQALDKTMAAVNGTLREQLAGEIKKRGDVLNTAQAAALASPLAVKQMLVHPVPAKTANGNAPVTLTQLTWMGALVTAVIQLQASRKTSLGKRSYSLLAGQIGSGLLFGIVVVASILLLNIHVIGLDVPEFWPVAGFLLLTFAAFFLVQAALLQYTGMAGMPLLVLLFFFGLPILALPYEFLPDITRHWFYSWVPFRFSVEGLRDLFFFRQGLGWSHPAQVLGWIGTVSLLVLLAAPLAAKRKDSLPKASRPGSSTL